MDTQQEQGTYAGMLGDSKCECADPGCPHSRGRKSAGTGWVWDCREVATTILYRVDMEDVTGTAMCEGCAEDALLSGLFTDDSDDAREEANG